jgi:transmembrane sensor
MKPKSALRVLALAFLVLFGPFLRSDSSSPPWLSSYHTAIGERLFVALPDGSTLELNTNTSAEVQFSADVRQVRLLSGELFLHVAHSPLPFEVFSGAVVIQDRATEFGVYRKPESTKVYVTEGRVWISELSPLGAVRPPDMTSLPAHLTHVKPIVTALELEAGGQVEVRDDLAIAAQDLSASELAHLTAWKDGQVAFSGASLVEGIAEIRRYTSVKFVIADPSIEQISLGGVYRATDVDGILEALHGSFGIDATSATDRRGIRVVTLTRSAKKDSKDIR